MMDRVREWSALLAGIVAGAAGLAALGWAWWARGDKMVQGTLGPRSGAGYRLGATLERTRPLWAAALFPLFLLGGGAGVPVGVLAWLGATGLIWWGTGRPVRRTPL